MTLRIDLTSDGPRVALRLTGRVRGEHLRELRQHLAGGGGPVTLDLDEVTLVDVEVVRFLRDAEDEGNELRNCPPFVREWINRERAVGG